MTTFAKLAIPNIVTNMIGFLSDIVIIRFAGHSEDATNVAVVGLAGTCCRILVSSILVGLNAAQETLTSQAFGADNLRLCGIYLNRGSAILTVIFIPLALTTSILGEQIFVAIGQDPQVSQHAASMVRIYLVTVFLWGQYDLRKRWLACQRITLVPMVASFVGTILLIPNCYLFMYTCDLGINGLVLAAVSKDFTVLFITVIYCYCKPEIRAVIQPHSCETLRGWSQYLMVSLPATVMVCAEWWAFEFLTVMAGILGVMELSSQTIAFMVIIFLFMIPLGIQEATCGLIGNCIGANNVPLAKSFFSMTMKVALSVILLTAITTIFARNQIAGFFTDDLAL